MPVSTKLCAKTAIAFAENRPSCDKVGMTSSYSAAWIASEKPLIGMAVRTVSALCACIQLTLSDVILVNTARGAIIDEAALIEFARSHPDCRLALDTFEVEPLPMSRALRALPNTILTPHMVGHTIETHRAGRRIAIEMVKDLVAGRSPKEINLRNPAVLPTWNARWSPSLGKAAS